MNKIEKGSYTLTLINVAGEKVSEQQVTYNGDGSTFTVSLPKLISSGAYKLTLQNKEVKISRLIMVQ